MTLPKIAVMWRGDIRDPDKPTHYEMRLAPVVEALQAEGLTVERIKYFDADAEAARARLKACGGALVWINPLADGQDRKIVDAVLRDAAAAGVWVSAHPDVIAKMGTKEVLFQTRHLGWGSDTALVLSSRALEAELPGRLAMGPRVLKPLRGNDGQGVLKVEAADGRVRVQHASDDRVETLSVGALMDLVRPHFDGGGRMIDQAFNPNARAGMVRCYMCHDRVAGFAVQRPRIEGEHAAAFAMASAKAMFGADAPEFAPLKRRMEADWTPGLRAALSLGMRDLPVLWDADFLIRPAPDAAGNIYVLCEINVSCVSPFPDAAPAMVAAAAKSMMAGASP